MDNRLYSRIAQLLTAIKNCEKTDNPEWKARHGDALKKLCRDKLPSGSGFDSGVVLLDKSTPERLVFGADYHHMSEYGSYDGWTEHEVIVTPSLVYGFQLRVTGRDRNDIKDYIGETMHCALQQQVAD